MQTLVDIAGVTAVWPWLLAGVGVLIAAFFSSASRAGGLWWAPVPRAMGSEAMCRGVVGGTIARRRAATGRPAGLLVSLQTFALRLWQRDTSLHHTTGLNSAELRSALPSAIAWAGALLLATGSVDLQWLHRLVDAAFDNPMAWETALSLFNMEEILVALTWKPAAVWLAGSPAWASCLGAVLAGVTALVAARRLAAFGRPFDGFRGSLAFLLCQERRTSSLHYTSEQFWLRIRGR